METGVKLTDLVEKMNLKNLTPGVDLTDHAVYVPDVNRPALQLTGFFDHFDSERVQIIGNVEYAYIQTLSEERKSEIYEKLLKNQIPCIIFSKNLLPEEILLQKAEEKQIPIFATDILFHGGADSLDECKTGTVYFHSRSTCGCVWCRCTDHGREWNR